VRPVLITAGATRNRIDAMRYISAHSSGHTGAHIAAALGAEGLLLLGSPEACLRTSPATATASYTDTLDLMAQMRDWLQANPRGILIHAAAVGDYMIDPDDPDGHGKLPSGQAELHLRLVPAPKILDQVRSWCPGVFLVSFKAAPPGAGIDTLSDLAHTQRERTGSDLVFANTIGRTDRDIVLVDAEGPHPHADRDHALQSLVQRIQQARAL